MRQPFGEPVLDAYEETFSLFSQTLPSNNLGFIDSEADDIELEIAGRNIALKQSPGLLLSQRKAGTTGAVLWKVTPLVAEWLVSLPTVLSEAGILTAQSTVVELGCGATGLIGILVAPVVANYILTDQAYVGKKVIENIDTNRRHAVSKRKTVNLTQNPGEPTFLPLDWELDTPSRQMFALSPTESIDLVIACDCVYNEHLIKPLVQTLSDICQLQEATNSKQTAVLIAQQLRSETIFNDFLDALMQSFDVWRFSDKDLPKALHTDSGYVVHVGWLKERKPSHSLAA